ncbi:hypothetical protein [Brachybacterium sp. YJGR34]|uniref:hypothetical protein n=1 Tax=Brachybacterium sp. YJGR34 TaxID=2059911 RepID=UPI0013009066|nr:hypothetical protein [Brachybacterium sp. YJGR34]
MDDGTGTPRPRAASRRALLSTAAWTAPIAITAVSAPAVAASAPQLGGSISLNSSCSGTSQTLTINGTSAYPTHGIWMERVPNAPSPTAASVTVYFSTTFGNRTWTRVSGGSTAWSIPVRDTSAPAISGFYAYTSNYTGAWTYDPANRRLYNAARPHFQTVRTGSTCVDPVTVYVRRRVVLGGQTYTLQRGPLNLAPAT